MRYFLLSVMIIALISGCSSRSPLHPPPQVADMSQSAVRIQQEDVTDTKSERRYVQLTARLVLESDTPDLVHKNVFNMAKQYDGYVLQSEIDLTTIRLPAQHFDEIIKQIEILGKIQDREISGNDVTEQYYDINIRLENAQKARDRYLDMLKGAETVESALKVERELERLNREIDLWSGRLKRLSHLVQYATITVSTKTPVRPGPFGYVFYALYSSIKWLFVWD